MSVKWYEFETALGTKVKVANPSFEQSGGKWHISGYGVTEMKFHCVLAEWEADQHATKPEPVESQWAPKVGDWVRVSFRDTAFAGRVFKVGRVHGNASETTTGLWFLNSVIEPATPQPVDKLGWWLIDGKCDCFIIRDGSCIQSKNDCVDTYDNARRYGIFLAEITDAELIAYHREGIVPKCPVEVQS